MNAKDQMSVIPVSGCIKATIIDLSVNPKSEEGGRKKHLKNWTYFGKVNEGDQIDKKNIVNF